MVLCVCLVTQRCTKQLFLSCVILISFLFSREPFCDRKYNTGTICILTVVLIAIHLNYS